jgi:hypothetical protein
MSNGSRHAAAALVFASIFAAAPALALASEPQEVVRSLYTEPNMTFSSAQLAGYFSDDLNGALKLRAAPTSFDYRYGAQDLQISDLEFVTDVDHDQARVVAVFKNYGRANSVDWTLCRRPDGNWRIADASSNTGPEDWDLRQLLRLPSVVHC